MPGLGADDAAALLVARRPPVGHLLRREEPGLRRIAVRQDPDERPGVDDLPGGADLQRVHAEEARGPQLRPPRGRACPLQSHPAEPAAAAREAALDPDVDGRRRELGQPDVEKPVA